jgi:hypothetical protein
VSVSGKRSDSLPLLGAAGAMVAVGCCALLSALGAILGGLTVAAMIGVAGGVLVAVVLAAAVLLWRTRRRRACATPRSGASR